MLKLPSNIISSHLVNNFQNEIRSVELLKNISREIFKSQTRNTAILKRRNPVNIAKMEWVDLPYLDYDAKVLSRKHFIYDLIEETNFNKKIPLKLILIQPVEGVGLPGDIVEVKPHRARNELLLPGLAVYASPENLEKYKDLTASADMPSSRFVFKTVKMIESFVYMVCMNSKNPWTVEPWHVRVACRKTGLIVPDSAITLPSVPIQGPDMNLEGKEFLVKIKINNKEEARARVRVHHESLETIHYFTTREQYWLYPAPPIFEDEAPILAELNSNDLKMNKMEDDEV